MTSSSNQSKLIPKWMPLRITLIYAIVGGLWILLSDKFVGALTSDPEILTRIAIFKGWFFIIATSLILHSLIKRGLKAVMESAEAVRASEERLTTIVETVADGLVIVDANGLIRFANVAAEAMLDLHGENMGDDGKEFPVSRTATLTNEALPYENLAFARAIKTGEPVYGVEYTITHRDAKQIFLSVNAVPLHYADNGIAGAVVSLRDITERKRIEEIEREVQAAAEEAKRLFYKRTILSVTDGKLNLVSRDEIDVLLVNNAQEINLAESNDLTFLRSSIEKICSDAGMVDDRTHGLVTAVSEAAANAVKHANGGVALVGIKQDEIQICIKDNGTGMDALILPKATLMKRFSTKASMGLGYSLILAYVDTVYLATDQHGTWVLMEQAIADPLQEISLEALPDTW